MSEDTSRTVPPASAQTVPPVLWEPAAWEDSRLGRFALRLEADYGVDLGRDYEALRRWSLEHLDTFWLEVWRELRLPASMPYLFASLKVGIAAPSPAMVSTIMAPSAE